MPSGSADQNLLTSGSALNNVNCVRLSAEVLGLRANERSCRAKGALGAQHACRLALFVCLSHVPTHALLLRRVVCAGALRSRMRSRRRSPAACAARRPAEDAASTHTPSPLPLIDQTKSHKQHTTAPDARTHTPSLQRSATESIWPPPTLTSSHAAREWQPCTPSPPVAALLKPRLSPNPPCSSFVASQLQPPSLRSTLTSSGRRMWSK